MRRFVLAALVGLVSDQPMPAFETEAHAAPLAAPSPSVAPFDERVGSRVTDPVRHEVVVPKKVHLKKDQVTPTIAQLAARYLDRPMLSETIRTIDGKRYSFCVEPHYHEPGSGLTPEGWHKGVTVYGYEE